MVKKAVFSILLALLSLLVATTNSRADEVTISVSGNGDGSQNQAATTVQNTTAVTQSNTASVTNTSTLVANSGNNTASSNTGPTTIQTGNAATTNTIQNQNINQNVAQPADCGCSGSTTVTVTNNGENSTNTVAVTQENAVTTDQSNTANIINTPSVSSNSGDNSANGNSGNTSIFTGNIVGKIEITNSNINTNIANTSDSSTNVTTTVTNNGEGTVNILSFVLDNTKIHISTNIADIFNDPILTLVSGDNSANGNSGNVSITTGDILGSVSITNRNINSSGIDDSCGCITTPINDGGSSNTPPQNPPQPSAPPSGSSSPSSNIGDGGSGASSGGSSQVLGLGTQLPATGSNLTFLMTLAALLFFATGLFLRLKSGLSPPVA